LSFSSGPRGKKSFDLFGRAKKERKKEGKKEKESIQP
jgi:hypothetical protein